MTQFLQQLINGLSIGSQYALWCVGYGLVYQVLGLMHFAHGDTLMFSAFVALTLLALGVPFWIVVIAAMIIAAILAIGIERTIYRPLMSRNQLFMAFIAAMAAGYLLRNVVQLIWGVEPRVYPEGLLPASSFAVGDLRISWIAIINLTVALAVVFLFQSYLSKTRTGQAITAVAQDRSTAELMGIPVNRIVAVVYGLSAAIGMLGLFMYLANFRTITIALGFAITLKAFIAAIIGGIGSIRGAVLGGLTLGVLEALVGGYISSVLLDGIVILVLVAFLLVRPNGMVGIKESVKL
ncbi:branched-chain amino acid ABC transporter permease [Rhodococcus fascians]|nr:branched-chain amino acid ABC transporter permease [Rhodococcus fascians]MBY4238357.1 branched-chain amino acid ABC transporter permease [Rhodococcus fascians]MBY4254262.1 branched-chain amino acid ABC transporter permease [Rhodococcus fascians]MBY4269643.1 branched-chain amino acid ABC transporter permease [Rhodococcus fascians]